MSWLSKLTGIKLNETIKEIGTVIDSVHVSDEERGELKAKIETVVSSRWRADMQYGSFLSRNIRPATLVYLLMFYTIVAISDGNVGVFGVKEIYVKVLETLLFTVFGGYFALRSLEKVRK